MSALLRLTVLTPERVLLDVDAAIKVRVRLADDALLSVYPGHAPLIAEVLPGPVAYQTEKESGELSVAGGILQVGGGQVTLLTSGTQRRPMKVATPSVADEDEDAAAVRRFDRLAQQLLLALQAQPGADTGPTADVTAGHAYPEDAG